MKSHFSTVPIFHHSSTPFLQDSMKRLTALITLILPAALLAEPVPSFRQDIMPILFRAGCNAGTCHGAAKGKDGFMLSLFGYDPAGDYHRIVNDITGRRINLAVPERSSPRAAQA